MRPGFLKMRKDNGCWAWVRVDEIAAVTENETKVDAKMVPCTTILLRNNLAWHFPNITPEQVLRAAANCGGIPFGEVSVEPPQ